MEWVEYGNSGKSKKYIVDAFVDMGNNITDKCIIYLSESQKIQLWKHTLRNNKKPTVINITVIVDPTKEPQFQNVVHLIPDKISDIVK